MKKFLIVLFCLFVIFLYPAKIKAVELPAPGFTPDSLFYFLETFKERIIILFTFAKIDKAKKEITFSTERVAEIQKMIEEKKWEATREGLNRYQINLERAEKEIEKTKDENKDRIKQKLKKAAEIHLAVLGENIKYIPPELEDDYTKTMDKSREALEKYSD